MIRLPPALRAGLLVLALPGCVSEPVPADTRGIAPQDDGLSERLTQAYNRRMGR